MTTSRVADPETSVETARLEVLRLAMAPLFFQAARAARDLGLLDALYRRAAEGADAGALVGATGLSRYAVDVLLEALTVSGLCQPVASADGAPGRFAITKAGVFWLKDELSRVHADFVHHVCYLGAFKLDQALREGRPSGLPALVEGYPTVYEALGALSPEVRRAWDAFDHLASDSVFGDCLPLLELRGGHLVDVGCNTGRFAQALLAFDPRARLTLVDLPRQLGQALTAVGAHAARVAGVALDLLDPSAPLPPGADVYWMSQVLDCFGEDEVRSILSRVAAAMGPASRAFILETYVDQQRSEGARTAIVGTSLYFTAIANGTSRMYASTVMRRLIGEAGLAVAWERHDIGLAHSLTCCMRADAVAQPVKP
ncbi:MAG: SAM-dependent methyltransferase [Myxococcaceae bacterium]|jgi:hypothetical protein|nr:SAM-dependent methyltransferase [Myxococcaceae bacterium]